MYLQGSSLHFYFNILYIFLNIYSFNVQSTKYALLLKALSYIEKLNIYLSILAYALKDIVSTNFLISLQRHETKVLSQLFSKQK